MFDWSLLNTLVLTLTAILIIVSIYICETSIKTFNYDEPNIPTFSTDVHFTPFPRSVNINNVGKNCDINTLQKCSISDPTTLFGCNELLARCHHFDKNITFINRSNEPIIIPKNNEPDEGYALALGNLSQACNPYHGDLVITVKHIQSNTYLLVCRCKYSGLVGNDHVMGNCTLPRICGGKVKDIDKPLTSLECQCSVQEEPFRYNSLIPICRPLTVLEANKKYSDWQHIVPWVSDDLLPIKVFDSIVQRNIQCSKLLNPCSHDLRDSKLRIKNGKYDTINNTCTFVDTGIPLRTGILKRNSGKVGATYNKFDTIDGVIYSGNYSKIRILDNVDEKRQMCAITAPFDITITPTENPKISYTVALGENVSVGSPGQVHMTNVVENLFAPICAISSLTGYSCAMGSNFNKLDNGIPRPIVVDPPILYLWGTEDWVETYRTYDDGVVNRGYGLELYANYLNKFEDKIKYYGLQLTDGVEKTATHNGIVGFSNDKNYNFHRNLLT